MRLQTFTIWSYFAVSLIATTLISPQVCEAGGGPENVLLVVNANSQASKTVANQYIDIRKIPSTNVLYLSYPPGKPTITSVLFRQRILEPILKEIENRKLGKQIDCVVYSCDFPWRVDFTKEYAQENLGRSAKPFCSLTGATYLHAFVMHDRKEMFSMNSNFYCAPPNELVVVSRAFRAGYRWSLGGRRAGQEGLPYMMSAILGVNSVPGNTIDEINWYLERAGSADGTAPKGTIYFAVNKTIRSTVRDREFPAAVRLIQLAGVRAEIIQAFFPQGKQDVAGVTSGHSNVNPAGSGSRLLPGAFCDNLTSSGGQFLPGKVQTLVSEFLRLGAAGANGTVVEPTAMPQKFPNSTLHVHYVHGCSLAESFYQSVASPFQQILVGDPLCQPWAKIPKVTVGGLSDDGFTKGAIELTPQAQALQGVASFQLFVDGVAYQQCLPGERFSLDTTALADGYHELRVVAVDSTPIETQGRWIGSLVVKNGRNAIQLSLAETVANSPVLNLKLAATNPTSTSILFNGVEVAKLPNGEGPIAIDKKVFGSGPIMLIAIADGKPNIRSQPLSVVISSDH